MTKRIHPQRENPEHVEKMKKLIREESLEKRRKEPFNQDYYVDIKVYKMRTLSFYMMG